MVKLHTAIFLLVVTFFVSDATAHERKAKTGNPTIGHLIDVVVNNAPVLQEAAEDPTFLSNQLSNREIRVVDVNDLLRGQEERTLSGILDNSQVFQSNCLITIEILNNSPILQNFLNDLNISIERVIAIDLLSIPISLGALSAPAALNTNEPVMVYLFDAH
jgi:hypothetical protein